MTDSQVPKVNFENAGWALVGIAIAAGLSGCASAKKCEPTPARVSLEKKIFSLEDQIEAQQRKIKSLQSELSVKKNRDQPSPQNFANFDDPTFQSMSAYYEAMNLRDSGQYDEAVEKLNRFIAENPDHVYSDRAQFLIVDSHFKNREFGLALVDSFQLENRYRESRKLPEALHKRGLAYLKLGDSQKGMETFRILIEKFPQSAASQSAKETLVSLQSSEKKE